METDNDTSEVT